MVLFLFIYKYLLFKQNFDILPCFKHALLTVEGLKVILAQKHTIFKLEMVAGCAVLFI